MSPSQKVSKHIQIESFRLNQTLVLFHKTASLKYLNALMIISLKHIKQSLLLVEFFENISVDIKFLIYYSFYSFFLSSLIIVLALASF